MWRTDLVSQPRFHPDVVYQPRFDTDLVYQPRFDTDLVYQPRFHPLHQPSQNHLHNYTAPLQRN